MITVPVVNSNGDSKESLVAQAMAIHHALEAAKRVLAESDLSHGRNFQTVEQAKYFAARNERSEQYKWLSATSDDYLKLAIAIDEQGSK